MDHTDHVRLTDEELTGPTLEGTTIYDRDDNEVSTVDHVHGSGEKAQVVFDIGGFLGIGSKRVSLFAGQLDFMRDEEGVIHAITQMTQEQLEAMPEHVD